MLNDKNKILVGQITWITYKNYGTFLQAFALQNTLNKLGIKSNIIDDKRFTFGSKSIRHILSKLISIFRKKNSSDKTNRYDGYEHFSKRFLNIDRDWKSYEDLTNRYDIFLCGSDQIWSPLLNDHHEGFYFASFAGSKNTKIAYGPSLGTKEYSYKFKDLISPWLSNFYKLSSREEEGTKILSEITGRKDIATVLDPTLLMTPAEWKEFEQQNRKSLIEGSYVLLYLLRYNESYIRRAQELAINLKLPLVAFDNLPELTKKVDYIVSGGPLEFITAIAHSNMVLTDSFHGTIFALNFKRKFITFQRFSNGEHMNQNSRIENLFKIVGIEDNFINEANIESLPSEPDWEKIEDNLSKERLKSINYLSSSFDHTNHV